MGDFKRNSPPFTGDDRAALTGFLQFHRETLAMKCAGLSAEQLRERATPPSSLSLLGLVRHMAEVERSWFRNVVNGEGTGNRGAGEFDVETADPDEVLGAWHAACARSRDIVDAAETLDVTCRYEGAVYSLRYVLIHMTQEYARHNGHADLLRERIDGATGE